MNTLTQNGVSVSVSINGRPTRVYLHEGKYFIESRNGSEYVIDISNNNYYRVEVVAAVDGLSVITGKVASKTDCGYVVAAWGKLQIKGYRKDNEEVGAFKFTEKEASYAAGKGAESNVGVIAIAVYKEYTQPVYWASSGGGGGTWGGGTWGGGVVGGSNTFGLGDVVRGTYTSTGHEAEGTSLGLPDNVYGSSIGSTSKSATYSSKITAQALNSTSRGVEEVGFDHGTTWGTKIKDKVVNTTFVRDGQILEYCIYYNSKEKLESLGIKLVQEKQITLPKGFPKDFAEPPPGWQG